MMAKGKEVIPELAAFYSLLPIVEVTEVTETVPFKDRETGQRKEFQKQVAYLLKTDRFGRSVPATLMISVPRGGDFYPPGLYVIGGATFKPNQFQALEMAPYELALIPIPNAVLDFFGVVDPYAAVSTVSTDTSKASYL